MRLTDKSVPDVPNEYKVYSAFNPLYKPALVIVLYNFAQKKKTENFFTLLYRESTFLE